MGLLNIEDIKTLVLNVEDFPKAGVSFKDITPVFEDGRAFKKLIDLMSARIPGNTTKLVAVESRGFVLAAAISVQTKIPFCLVRKKGKLPRQTFSQKYSLEYGEDELFIHQSSLEASDRVVIIDDVLATGGTASAVESLCLKFKLENITSLFFIELGFLKGSSKLQFKSESLLIY